MTDQISSHYTEKNILITGAGGFIASNLVEALKGIRCRIIRLSSRRILPKVSGVAKIEDHCGNWLEQNVWDRVLRGVDIIFHFAAQTSVAVAEQNPQKDMESNVLPMLNLLESCRRKPLQPTILFSSTVTVAGIPERIPVDESTSDHPITVYDLHKLMAEQYLKHYIDQGVVQGVALRLSNVYGPGPKSSRADRGILNQMILRALAGTELTVYGNGDQLRDYIHVSDVARAFLSADPNIQQVNGQHFVIGSCRGHTLVQALNLVADRVSLYSGRRVEVKHVDPPSLPSIIESRNFVADTHRYMQATGWQPKYGLAEGIDQTIKELL